MRPQEIIRSGITASAIAHASALALVLLFTEVHPFGGVTAAEPMTVDLVLPAEAEPSPQPEQSAKSESPTPPATELASNAPVPGSPPSAAAPPQEQAVRPQPSLDGRQIDVAPQTPPTSPSPAFTPPEPDLSIKYHVMLGLPSIAVAKGGPGDHFDAPASEKAEVDSSLISEFRRHLKTCAKLPDSIAPSDKISITLRAFMTPKGRLAMKPILIEASASAKGPALMQSAINALEVCQPYEMLPADRYGEWKVLDLSFTPRDFAGAS
jgi:hypothetical protein